MWQTRLGRCIYESPSGYKVYQNYFYRWLTLGNDILQTVIHRSDPGRPVLYYLPALTLMTRTQPGTSCLLGLGGGSVAHLLEPYHRSLTAIECSSDIIDIAQRLFMIDKLSYLSILHQRAEDYLTSNSFQYEHLLVDLYDASHFPQACHNEQFFALCQQRITANGFMSINLANTAEQWPLFQLVKKYFHHTLVIPIKGSANMVVIASNQQSHSFMEILHQCQEIKKIILLDKWGKVAVY